MRNAGRTTTVVVLALAAAMISACHAATAEPDDDPSGEAGEEATVEAGDEVSVDAGNKAAVKPGDEECDERHFGDYKIADDRCWAPPYHYCAQGGGAAITWGCDPQTGICCGYGSTCIPCGFVDCTLCIGQTNPRADCPAVCSGPVSWDQVACKKPDMKLTICYPK